MKEKVKKTSFLGYDQVVSNSKLICILNQGKIVNRVDKNQKDIILIFDKTPFYAEGGGQVGDSGEIFCSENNLIANVSDTQKVDGDIFLHFVGKNLENICVNQTFELSVNEERRVKIRNNHSATHLLHASLRSVLGDHISQKGSLVNEEKLRFDFTYNEQLSDNDVNKIESLVNQMIRANIDSKIEYLPTKKAIKTGAIALFGEKYPENVRVISFRKKKSENSLSSMELCGGTHVNSTGQIGTFKIISDHSVSSGVKRIEAITGEEAETYFSKQNELLLKIKDKLKANESNILEKIENLKKDLASYKKNKINENLKFSTDKILQNKKFKCYFDILDIDQKELKNFSDLIKKKP